MVCREVIEILEEHSPGRFACTWDNVGLLVGDFEQEVTTIYIALDATDETIGEAAAAGADLLLTHHPLIFQGLKKVNTADYRAAGTCFNQKQHFLLCHAYEF